MTRTDQQSQASPARTRLLSTASRVFYTEGIHSVGVDRIVAEAQVTRATLYPHCPGKEELVLAYLREADRSLRSQVDAVTAGDLPPADSLRAVAEGIAAGIRSPGFRGCAFLNAVAEYPDPAHPVHQAVLEHRQWFLDTVTAVFSRLRETSAPSDGRHFVMLRDGAMAAGCLFDPDLVCETFLAGVDSLLRAVAGQA